MRCQGAPIAFFLSLLLAAIPSTSAGQATNGWWPDFPTPKGADVGWIAQDIIYNGVPMRILDMKSALPANDILDFYRKKWRDDQQEVPLAPYKQGQWMVLDKRTEQLLYTVKTHNVKTGGSESELIISRLPELQKKIHANRDVAKNIRESLGAGFPKLHDSIVQMDMESFDPGKTARTIMYRNTYDVEANVLYVTEELISSGWTKIVDQKVKAESDARKLVYRRDGGEEIVMTVRRGPGATEIIVNHTKEL